MIVAVAAVVTLALWPVQIHRAFELPAHPLIIHVPVIFVPILGLLVGAAMGAASASLADVGIDDDFIKEVREKVTPGTSALFALTSDGVPDKVAEAFRGVDGELLHTNLSSEQEAQLREVFSDAHAV